MPVVHIKDKDKDEIRYLPPEAEILKKKSNELIKQFCKYAEVHGLSIDNVCIQKGLLPRIILRVDKREGYFMVFHDQTRINEIKQAALVAYWVLKLKPFMVITDDPIMSHKFSRINEGFAAFYLLSAFKQYAKRNGNEVKELSPRLVEELMYAFTYWDLSKESAILIAETIGEAFFGITAQGVEENCHS
ncbi:MAG: hypothetical protein IJ299_00285 [Oscillospiraceae bacterium]|nr:hypothetical protein [Oscillospiraceae bacterium]